MICQRCLQRQASMHFTQIINNEKTELHLCEQCAREMQSAAFDSPFHFISPFSINNFLTGLLGGGYNYHVQAQERSPMPVCNVCHMTYDQFVKGGKLGCANCYEVFNNMLEPVLKKIHGGTYHHGKLPQRAGGVIRTKRELNILKQDLNKAIQGEEYEKAAQLRDRIRELETQLKEDF